LSLLLEEADQLSGDSEGETVVQLCSEGDRVDVSGEKLLKESGHSAVGASAAAGAD
jgi:hypothetical protein